MEVATIDANDHPSVENVIRPLAIHVDREILTRIEMEAARTLIIGVTSLCVTGVPYVIFVGLFYLCRFVNQSECSHFNWLAPYMKELGLIHAVYSPLIFLARNKEMKQAMTCQMYKGWCILINFPPSLSSNNLANWYRYRLYFHLFIAHYSTSFFFSLCYLFDNHWSRAIRREND